MSIILLIKWISILSELINAFVTILTYDSNRLEAYYSYKCVLFFSMPRDYKSKTEKRYKKHDPELLREAVADIKNNNLPFRKAATKYGISYGVLYRHTKGRVKRQGGQTSLSNEDEKLLVSRLQVCSDWGYPLDSFTLRGIVKDFLDRQGKTVKKFRDNLPGKEFVWSFMKRHKESLSKRMCQNIKRSRASVSPEIIRDYFNNLTIELAGVPPANIINYDETNLCDDPGKKLIIARRGCKYPERVMNSTKTAVSVMFAAAADGTILQPYVVYKALHLYNSWTEGYSQAHYNRTKSGWFDQFCFEDWIKTIAIPYLKKQSGKRILIGDNLSSHLTTEVIKICYENDVHMIFLPANATHLTQPLDVAFFRPMKMAWRKILEEWKVGPGHREASLQKDVFPRLLGKLMKSIQEMGPENVRSGFRKCGIVPLDVDAVLKRLPSDQTSHANQVELLDNSLVELLKTMRYGDGSTPKRKKRVRLGVEAGKSVVGRDSTIEDEDSEPSVTDLSLHDTDSDLEEMKGTTDEEDGGNVGKASRQKIAVGTFVAVRVSSIDLKKSQNYAARVIDILDGGAKVSFLRKKKGLKETFFVFPDNIEEEFAKEEDLLQTLTLRNESRNRFFLVEPLGLNLM